MHRNTFIIFFIYLFSLSLHYSQIPGLINFNENDGLNSSYTYRLKQDDNGFIWIGSDNGLFRFDGKEFKRYGKEEGLRNIDVITCEPLSNGEIFIMPYLNDFAYLKNGKIFNYPINLYLKNQFTNSFPLTNRDKSRLYLYNPSNPRNIFIYENGKVKKEFISINYEKKDLIAFKYDFRLHTLFLKNNVTDTVIAYNLSNKKEKKIGTVKGDFVCEKNGLLVFNDKKTINIYHLRSSNLISKINSYKLDDDFIYASIDKNNKLWINLAKGGALYFNQSLLSTEEMKAPIRVLEEYTINNVLVDKDDNVWFNSRSNGLFFIARGSFNSYISMHKSNNSEYIKAIAKDGNNIILGYNKSSGAFYKNGQIIKIDIDRDNKKENRTVYANGNKLIFGLSDKVVIYDISKKRSFTYPYSSKNIVPYEKDSVLLCTSHGLLVYNLRTDKIKNVLSERTYTAVSCTKDSLFVGNFSDLYKFNIKTKAKKIFLAGYYFTDIKKLQKDYYIGGTNLNGIIVFNNKGILLKITKIDGLLSDQIKKIDVESSNVFWASTNSGISRIEVNKNNVHINNFTYADGLPSNVTSGCVVKNDTVFVATSKGLGIFVIKNWVNQKKIINKKVIINSIRVDDKEYFNPNTKLQSLPLNDVIFNLSFLDYPSQGKIGYKYKVKGLSESWQTINSSRIILSSIPPGKYIFQVIGLGHNGRQSYTTTEFPFEILPHFWQTLWFKLLSIISVLIILHILSNLYFRKQRQEKLRILYHQKKNAELELQAIKAQVNPHFIYNCLNSIQFLLCKGEYKETENYLDTFGLLMRKTLHYSEKTFISIAEETEYLSLYMDMEKLKENEFFDYEINVSPNVNKNCVIPSLLIQPFVENSIKHGFCGLKGRTGHIKVSFDCKDGMLSIRIEDNGKGFKSAEEISATNNSFGLKLSKKRIETFKQLFDTNIILEIINLSEEYKKNGTHINLYITPYDNKCTNQYRG